MAIHKIRKNHPDKHTYIEVSNFNFLDIETTGLRPDRGAKITEIAILNRNNLEFIWPEEIDIDTQQIHRQLPTIYRRLQTGVIVGHNLSFDFWFLSHECEKYCIETPSLRFIDTLSLSRKLIPGLTCYKLEDLIAVFDIKVLGKLHTAVTDAEATRALFWKLVEKGGISTVGEAGMKKLNWSSF